jgi:branched-chain amino acid transport system substrate-binding protein
MKTRRSIGSFFTPFVPLVVTLAIALTVCGLSGSAKAQEEFKYGALMPVTGPIPQYGEYFIRGSQLALEDLEKSGWIGGKKIRIILEDGKADPKVSLAAMNKLVNIDKVPMVESLVTPVVLSIGPVAQQSGVVLMNTAAQSAEVRKIGNFVFSMNPLADVVMAENVEFAAKGMKAKTVAVLQVNSEYGRAIAETFKNIFEGQYGGKVVASEIINMGETDFTTHLTKIKFVKSDIIFMVAHEAELGYALKKAKQIGLKTPWLCTPGMVAPMTFEIAGDAIEGLHAPDYIYDAVNGTELMKSFGRRYKEKFGILPHTYPAYSYDSVMIYAAALKSGARTPAQIRDYYFSMKNYQGASGPVAFGKDGVSLARPVIRQCKGGIFLDVKWK